jgi:hypothetical protein
MIPIAHHSQMITSDNINAVACGDAGGSKIRVGQQHGQREAT